MSDHDDFIDEYIEYRMFEESMKQGSGGGKPPKKNAGKSGCGTWCLIIAIAVIVLSVFGSCSNNNRKSYTSSRGSYSTSSTTSSSRPYSGSTSNSYQSKTASSAVQPTTKKSTYKSYSSKSKSNKTEDEYSAKDYVDADDFYYDHYDDFYDYEDAEDYWGEHQDD